LSRKQINSFNKMMSAQNCIHSLLPIVKSNKLDVNDTYMSWEWDVNTKYTSSLLFLDVCTEIAKVNTIEFGLRCGFNVNLTWFRRGLIHYLCVHCMKPTFVTCFDQDQSINQSTCSVKVGQITDYFIHLLPIKQAALKKWSQYQDNMWSLTKSVNGRCVWNRKNTLYTAKYAGDELYVQDRWLNLICARTNTNNVLVPCPTRDFAFSW